MQKYDFFSITMQNAPEICFNSPPMFQKSIFVAQISVPYRLLFKKLFISLQNRIYELLTQKMIFNENY